jgi:hypothetical protein
MVLSHIYSCLESDTKPWRKFRGVGPFDALYKWTGSKMMQLCTAERSRQLSTSGNVQNQLHLSENVKLEGKDEK